ncbi:MAG: cation:proton antiporter, partial [Chthoniobacteraceae bacterium]
GWTILAFIGGLAAHGKVVLGPVLISVCGTIVFLVLCFTIGHRWVARVIRWANDRLIIEMPVISVILVLMIALSLLTDFIGVHTVLGAFVAGIMIGQSPILTKHIEEQLRGLIVALFMPVFFGVAGLSINLKVLGDPDLLWLALLVIGIASIGKLGGCYLGSRLARLNHHESLAIGLGMNARGSTEVILATIGLSMGVLNSRLFTIIVLMAVVTTLAMPPLLRWALARVRTRPEEQKRLENEQAEEKDLMPKVERMLVGLDDSDVARLAGRLAGWLVGARRLTATVMDASNSEENAGPSQGVAQAAEKAMAAIAETETATEEADEPTAPPKPRPVKDFISIRLVTDEGAAPAILAEAEHGYGLLFLGLLSGTKPGAKKISPIIGEIIRAFTGPIAILLDPSGGKLAADGPLEKILVPTTGADYSRFGAEVAVAIAKGCGATITALHVSVPPPESDLLRRPDKLLRTGRALLADIVALGEREKVRVVTKVLVAPAKESAILRRARLGGHQLIVLGTTTMSGHQLHFGQSVETIIATAPCPVLIVKS